MEKIGSGRIEKEALKILAVISLNLGGCTSAQEAPLQPIQQSTARQTPFISEVSTGEIKLPPILSQTFSEPEYRESIDSSWIMKEVRALTVDELAQENLVPEDIPALLEELFHSFSDRFTLSGEPLFFFNAPLFDDGVKIRFKNGDLPQEYREQAPQMILNGLKRGYDGARISTAPVTHDEEANTFCTFKPIQTLGKFDIIEYSIYEHESRKFVIINKSRVEFRLPSVKEDSVKWPPKEERELPETLKQKALAGKYHLALFAASEHEIIGHASAYAGSLQKTINPHSKNGYSFMYPENATISIAFILPGDTIPSSESVTIEESDYKLGIYYKDKTPPHNDVAYKTIRLKRILYNKFVHNKTATLLTTVEYGKFWDDWKTIPE